MAHADAQKGPLDGLENTVKVVTKHLSPGPSATSKKHTPRAAAKAEIKVDLGGQRRHRSTAAPRAAVKVKVGLGSSRSSAKKHRTARPPVTVRAEVGPKATQHRSAGNDRRRPVARPVEQQADQQAEQKAEQKAE
jgi:hypothetical protein